MSNTTAAALDLDEVVNGRTRREWLAYADELDGAATRKSQASAESFARCDTDGFLSQWAHDTNSRVDRANARIARNFGFVETRVLFNLDGTVASTHEGEGQYGPYWVLNDEAAARFGKRFVSMSKAHKDATRRKNNRAKGFTVGVVRVKGHANTWAPKSARGLGGCLSVSVVDLPDLDALKAGDFEVVTTEYTREDY